MCYPKTKKEWWILLDENWPNLLGILHRFIGMNDHENIKGEITEHTRNIEIDKMRKNNDRNIVRYLNGAWFNAPDDPSIHDIPGWHILCDLCSEEHVLDEV